MRSIHVTASLASFQVSLIAKILCEVYLERAKNYMNDSGRTYST